GEGLITPYAVCRLGSKKRELNTAGFNQQQMEALSSKLLVENIYEDEANLFVKLMWGWNSGSHYITFNKRTQNLYNVGKEGFQNDIDGGVPFFPDLIRADGTKVMWMQAEDFIEQIVSLDYNKQKEKFGEKFERVRTLASQMKPDDNPILILLQ
ncbi:MAG: hypothetical protein LBL58_12205, partial [Tannerellaceae bacterium]|nr:hypothetical protein [Tannerellaceae bacterium]